MTMKWHKFRQNLDDFEKGKVFDLTVPRGQSQSRHSRYRSTTRSRNRQHYSGSESGDNIKSVGFVYVVEVDVSDLGPLGNHPKEEGRVDTKDQGRGRGGGGNTRGIIPKIQKQIRTRSTKY